MGSVGGLWRYPVKSAGGERLEHIEVTASGVVGDRLWAVVDEDGAVVSAKHPTRGGRLLQVACRYADASGETWLRTPGGSDLLAGSVEANAALSAWLARPVHLTKQALPDVALRRRWPALEALVPEWERRAIPGSDAVTPMAGPALRRSFVDYGAVHLIFAHELRELTAAAGRAIDPRRFRPNIMVDASPALRDAERIRVSDLTLAVELPTPRCPVPGLSPEDATLDPALLRALARFDRRAVGTFGKAACFGLYVTPESSGTASVGDPVSKA